MKICKKCKIEKEDNCFSKHRWECKNCIAIYNKNYAKTNSIKIAAKSKNYRENNKVKIAENNRIYYLNNRSHLLNKNKIYAQNNKEKIKIYQQNYYQNNKEYIKLQVKQYQKNNKDKILLKNKKYRQNNRNAINQYHSNRKNVDINYKLRTSISSIVSIALKVNGGSKKGKSILDYLPYTIEELKIHLEKQFKPWMNWTNRGAYSSEAWNDFDSTTWTWQLDHIQPHSDFPYTSMEDQLFQDCWKLSNLRPYSAKLNQIDGATKIRHKKEEK
jgi:hypothetical protein